MVRRHPAAPFFHPHSILLKPASLHQRQFRDSLLSVDRSIKMTTIHSHTRFAESWIEVSSQPSSSSLSSAAADDANPAALGVQFDQYGRRRRRLLRVDPDAALGLLGRRRSETGGSSQEEYEESESESDRILTSSNENIGDRAMSAASPQAMPSPRPKSISEEYDEEDDDDDDDENATALGVAIDPPAFTPPPNAFSHPARRSAYHTQQTRSQESRTSYFPARRASPSRRHSANSYPSRGSRTNHTPYDLISNHQSDHDAALRASLSTLLSCAAAARGLPKDDQRFTGHQRGSNLASGPSNRIEPSALRLVSQSALPTPQALASNEPASTQPAPSSSSDLPQLPPRPRPSSLSRDRSKRKASPSAKDRAGTGGSHKKRTRSHGPSPRQDNAAVVSTSATGAELVHPTLMTWVMSAGIVILFSAISFSAGYAMGREVGRLEVGGAMQEEGIVCGREVGKGLRRLRWGTGAAAGGLSVIRTT